MSMNSHRARREHDHQKYRKEYLARDAQWRADADRRNEQRSAQRQADAQARATQVASDRARREAENRATWDRLHQRTWERRAIAGSEFLGQVVSRAGGSHSLGTELLWFALLAIIFGISYIWHHPAVLHTILWTFVTIALIYLALRIRLRFTQ
jgi:hypothetical protein